MTNPVPEIPDVPDEFDRITCGVPMVSAWQAMFAEAEEMLRATRPEGFDVEEIGRTAFHCLPERERDAALDVLFYTYWAALQSDRETLAQHESEVR
ncbi:hypothetical protein FHS39_002514 [Streptomyces olivoverticillatus]|uniref:Uncharacterized protein n=1 Tax=Streptomyces olivoverticillatus TaxID=66427 RepID=A0A7W7LNG4_9ACTN|nr:hypothetical protein [Streptomyces olivoverticillatus]MBB4893483.1 hypothetical protein [Streptomyces olivoverticillatus]